jgi:hypothetical protein
MSTFPAMAQINSILMHQVKNAKKTMSNCEKVFEVVMAQEVDILWAMEEWDTFVESNSKQQAMCIKMTAFISKKPASPSK